MNNLLNDSNYHKFVWQMYKENCKERSYYNEPPYNTVDEYEQDHRTFLIKAKRLIKLNQNIQTHQSIDKAIINFKPPIFWKDKEIVKKQIKIWTLDKTYKLIDEINKIELNVKKNSINSLKILFDFILATSKTNN